jgi:allantoinase
VVRGERVVTPEGVVPAAVWIAGGEVVAVRAPGDVPPGAEVVDAGALVVMPGLVDTHVHCNEPGRTEWEGFATATAAAAAGGVTTLVDMPLNSVPATTSVAGLRAKLAAAEGKLGVDVGFWGGVVPGNVAELRPLWEAGVLGFKCFLAPSGVDEFPHVGDRELRAAMPVLAALGAPLLAHAELPASLERAAASLAGAEPRRHATWLASRPAEAELAAIDLLLRLAEEHGARVHVVHLATALGIAPLRRARAAGLPVTVETCPHYLTFAAEEVPDGATDHKCAPPLRERANRERLWDALREGEIDMVVSDHSPCPPALKLAGEGDFLRAWGGIASLELGLAAVWSGLTARGGARDAAGEPSGTAAELQRLASLMCAAPASLAGLDGQKGRIATGYDADLVVWDPEATFRVDPQRLRQRHPVTPYAGRELRGVVHTTFLRGRRVYQRGEPSNERTGRLLRRGAG